MTVAAHPGTVTIGLLGDCATGHCLKMGWQLKQQLDPAYTRLAALLPMDGTFQDYLARHRTARRRAARAGRLGYTFQPVDRPAYEADVYEINTSMPERQGRPMTAGYRERPRFSPNPMLCPRHYLYTYGVLGRDDRLAAYLWLYRSGDLAMVSTILGHADRLEDGVMYQLFLGMLERQWRHGGTVFYNLWNSGQEGLKFFKERLGLRPGSITWELV